jgi:rhamnosyltransferase
MPWSWKTTELVKLPVRLVVYSFFPDQRSQHIMMALRGLRDGWVGRLGRH